jgi:transcriptional regulator with GAF, ATPase, and Fis domain
VLERVRAHLVARGITVTPRDGGTGRTTRVVVLDAVTSRALEHLRAVSGNGHGHVVVVVTGPAGLPRGDGWRLLEHGAADVLTWHPQLDDQLDERLSRWAAVAELVESDLVRQELVGSSPCWLGALTSLVEAARFSSSALLITGESGTGKELAARLVHHLDPRVVRGRLVVVDCTTVVPGLSGSEFFGHEKGAFTGAHAVREGAFAAAHGGTLFLDEVGELPLPLQAELLRVVQEGSYKRVGGNDWLHTAFRLVCATNRDLRTEVQQGRFRADLYYRMAAAAVTLPPLRDRSEDVLPLFHHFVRVVLGDDLEVDPEVADLLQCRPYPGNVRDLRQLVMRVLTRHVGVGPISVGDVPEDERPRARALDVGSPEGPADRPGEPAERPGPPPQPAPELSWDESEVDALVRAALDRGVRFDAIRTAVTRSARRVALQRADGNQKRAAEMLGVTARALQKQQQRFTALVAGEPEP